MRDEAFIRAGLDVRFRVAASAVEIVPAILAMAQPADAKADEDIARRF